MEQSDIENRLQEIISKSEVQSHKFNLANLKYGWVVAILALAVSIATISILLIDKGLVLDEQKTINISATTIWIVSITVIVAFLFAVLNIIADKSFLKKISEQTFFKKDIVEFFLEIVRDINIKNRNLDHMLQEITKTTDNFEKAPFENLISWYNAEKIEDSAQKVWSISYTLKWLNENRINKILNELVMYPDHEYHYIVLNKDASADRINLVKKLKKEFALQYKEKNGTEIHFGERFYLKYCGNTIDVPIPNDTSVYQSFADKGRLNHEIVVINTVEFHGNGDEENEVTLKSNFDFKFDDNAHVTRVKQWFDHTWKELNHQ